MAKDSNNGDWIFIILAVSNYSKTQIQCSYQCESVQFTIKKLCMHHIVVSVT